MGKYTYTDDEYDRNKVLKYNQNLSAQLSHEVQCTRPPRLRMLREGKPC